VFRQSNNVDIGYISLFEAIGTVAVYFVQSAMKGPSLREYGEPLIRSAGGRRDLTRRLKG